MNREMDFKKPQKQPAEPRLLLRMYHQIHRLRLCLTFFLVLFCIIAVSGVDYTEQIDSDSLIRIHVLANSNSEADQALKAAVKDSVVQYLRPMLEDAASLEESRSIICSSLPQMEAVALQTIRQEGYSYDVTMQYGRFDFPVKYYGSFSLPAGNYEALRILIGEGTGRNWWCVLFPPLCFTDSNVSASGKYTSQTPESDVVIRFKSIEWLKDCIGIPKDEDAGENSLPAESREAV